MLPYVKTAAVSAIAATSIFMGSLAPAQAFGDRERAFLQGIAAAVIVDKLVSQPRHRQPVYVAPARLRCTARLRCPAGDVCAAGTCVSTAPGADQHLPDPCGPRL